MILTDAEIMDINQNAEFDSAIGYARAIESAVLEKLKAQKPFGYYENGRFSVIGGGGPDKWRERKAYRGVVYTYPLPPDDVVRDAERYRWLRADYDSDICVVSGLDTIDYGSSGVAATYETCLCLEELDAAIDKAMKEKA